MEVQYDEGARSRVLKNGQVAKRGEPATVPDEMGRKLIKQDWREVKPAPPSTPPKATPKVAPKKED